MLAKGGFKLTTFARHLLLRLRLGSLFCTFSFFVAFLKDIFSLLTSRWKDFRVCWFWTEVLKGIVLKKLKWSLIQDRRLKYKMNWIILQVQAIYTLPASSVHTRVLYFFIEILVTSCTFAAKFWSALAFRQFIKLCSQSIQLKSLLRLHFINTNWI